MRGRVWQRARRWWPWAVAGLAAAAAAVPSGTQAIPSGPQATFGCGGVDTARAAHHPRGMPAPLAIGDSTMLLALDRLAARGYDVNAHGCRQFPEALALLESLRRAGRLPHMVVIALGADGSVGHRQIGQALGLLCCTRLLVLVTPRELGGGSGADAAAVREEVARHPGRARLLDWVAHSRGHVDWFQPDGLHLTSAGAAAFTAFLARALPWAYPPTAPSPPVLRFYAGAGGRVGTRRARPRQPTAAAVRRRAAGR